MSFLSLPSVNYGANNNSSFYFPNSSFSSSFNSSTISSCRLMPPPLINLRKFNSFQVVGSSSLPNCSFCLTDTLKNAANVSLPTVPMQVEVPSQMLENFWLPNQTRQLRPKEAVQRRSLLKPRTGLDRWYLRKRLERLESWSQARSKLYRTQKALKRLQNRSFMHQWRLERRLNFQRAESIRQSKLELLRRKGIKAQEKTECSLWNCPRKIFRRKRPFMKLELPVRSPSTLSVLSKRSRSPITFSRD